MRAYLVLLVLLVSVPSMAGQLVDAIENTENGRITFTFTTREGVWGDGRSICTGDCRSSSWDRDWTEGPGFVRIRMRSGRIADFDVEVGGAGFSQRSDATDLGHIAATEVAEAMLWLAENRDADELDSAVFAATLTEGFDDWPRVIRLARNDDRPEEIREAAVFWLGQAATEVATKGLTEIVDDDDEELSIREHAIFSLSQRDPDECIPALTKVAMKSRHPQLREKALFWLAQHDDPRVVDLLEEIIIGN